MFKKHLAAAAVCLTVLFLAGPSAGIPAGLKDFLADHPTVKICVELKNSSGDGKIDVNLLKKLLEEAFSSRQAYKFVVADTPAEADIVFKGDIVEYFWTENDPVDEVWGIGAAALDAATNDNYVRIQVRSELATVKGNHTLWSDKVQANVTQHVMPKDSSYELAYHKFVKSVMTELFRKRVEDKR